MKNLIIGAYEILRYRTWIVYDPYDSSIVYAGRRRDCLHIQETMYGGLVVMPLKDPYI